MGRFDQLAGISGELPQRRPLVTLREGAAWGRFERGAAPLDVPLPKYDRGDWQAWAADYLRKVTAKMQGGTQETARLSLLADALERKDLKLAKRVYAKLTSAQQNKYITVAAREALGPACEPGEKMTFGVCRRVGG